MAAAETGGQLDCQPQLYMEKHFVAIDLGATSGRIILGTLDDKRKLTTNEINRFQNRMIHIGEGLYWDIYSLLENIKQGLAIIAQSGSTPTSIGIDTWGVDFGCIAPDGTVIGLPMAYRDPRTVGASDRFFNEIWDADELYSKTGIQHLDFNTIFRFNELRDSFALKNTETILFIPDLIAYLLTGEKVTEYTIASTGAIVDPADGRLNQALFEAVGLSADRFGRFVTPGTVIGKLSKDVAEETGLPQIPVVAVGEHDTASAVAAVPARTRNFAYLSSGTWSLMGIEVTSPVINDITMHENITNEGGVEGTIRLLKNITGMWIVEECLRHWKKNGLDYNYQQMVELALAAPANICSIDPDDPGFVAPANMLEAIDGYCRSTGQQLPSDPGEYIRVIFESLAKKYARVLDIFKKISDHPIECLHIIGGGSRNSLLNRFTADAIGMPVVAGPAEATAYGNIMIQAKAAGSVSSLDEIRDIIAENIELTTFNPH